MHGLDIQIMMKPHDLRVNGVYLDNVVRVVNTIRFGNVAGRITDERHELHRLRLR